MGWMNIILGLAGCSVLIWYIFRVYQQSSSFKLRPFYFPFLILKFLGGVGLGVIYFYYYQGGDTVNYHKDALLISQLAVEDINAFFQLLFGMGDGVLIEQLHYHNDPRALLMSKFLGICYLFAFNNYWIASIFFSFYSFLGLWFLADVLLKNFNIHQVAVSIAFFVFPSVVFWSSGVLKESLLVGSMGFLIGIFVRFIYAEKWKLLDLLFAFLLIWIIWLFKYYYAAILIPIMISLLIIHRLKQVLMKQSRWFNGVLLLILVSLIIFGATFLHPNLHINRLLHVLVENYHMVIKISKPGNVINFDGLQPEVVSVIVHFPKAIFSGLYRPFIWETYSWLGFLTGLENTFLLLLSVFSISKIKNMMKQPEYLWILAVLVFILIMAGLLSISSPNFGSLSRYRVGFMPFFLLLVLNPFIRFLTSNKD